MQWVLLILGLLLIAAACPVKIIIEANTATLSITGAVSLRYLFFKTKKRFELGLEPSPPRWRMSIGRRKFGGPLFRPGRPIWFFRHIDTTQLTKRVLKRLSVATLRGRVKIGLPDAAACALTVGALNGIIGALRLRGIKIEPDFNTPGFTLSARTKIAAAIAPATLIYCLLASILFKEKKHAKRH